MTQRIGILLLEKTEVIIRIYEVDEKEWRLVHYQSMQAKTPFEAHEIEAGIIVEIVAEFFITDKAQYVNEWKAAARGFSRSTINDISQAIGLNIENLSPIREQELICKGLFTELW